MSKLDSTIKQKYESDMMTSSVATICNVPHCTVLDTRYCGISHGILDNPKNIAPVTELFENYSQPLSRAYSLCTTHEVQKLLNRKQISSCN